MDKIRSGFKQITHSNTFTGKLGFIIIAILIYVVVVKIGIMILSWALTSSQTVLISGMRPAKEMIIFPQNPNLSGSKPVFRSVNQEDGIEFTWSISMFIDNLEYNQGKYRCVF